MPRSLSITSISASCQPNSRRLVRQRVLQAEALLVCQHLMWGGLSHVNHRPPPEMVRFDEFRAHRSSPGGRRRDPPRPAGARGTQALPHIAGLDRHPRSCPPAGEQIPQRPRRNAEDLARANPGTALPVAHRVAGLVERTSVLARPLRFRKCRKRVYPDAADTATTSGSLRRSRDRLIAIGASSR